MYKKTIYTKTVLPLLFLAALLVSLSFKTPQTESNLKAGLSLLDVSAEQVTLRCTPPESAKTGILELEIYSIQGQLLAKATRKHQGVPLEVSLITSIDKKSLADYYLCWRFDKSQPFQQRSLLLINELMEITMLGQRQFFAGTSPVIRVLVRDRAAGTALAGAKVAAQLSHENNIISKFIANTDINGEVAVKLDMPPTPLQKVLLKVTVSSQNTTETIEEPIDIISPTQTLLTTDKPIYQPGQTIHIRALSLAKSDMKPIANTTVTFEVEDSKGNKVFKTHGTTDDFGISHTKFVLADELNEGNYRVTAIVAGVTTDKTVRVEHYVLPKFKIDFRTDNSFYQPGQTLKGDIQTDYFFGKPLTGATVQIKCAKFDVQYTDFQTIQGKTASTVNINSDNSDLLQLIDLQDVTGKGNHDISLEVTGESAMLYQIIGRYYLPRPQQPPVLQTTEPLTIELNYDRTELATDDIISVSATVTNNQPHRAKMVIVDLALPPGFTLIPDRLNQLVQAGAIEKYSLAGRGIIIYLREIDSKKSINLAYQLRAKFPLKAQTPLPLPTNITIQA